MQTLQRKDERNIAWLIKCVMHFFGVFHQCYQHTFLCRKAYIQIDFVQGLINTSRQSTELAEMLQEPYDTLMQIEKDFLYYGYKDCSVETLMARANIRR